MPSNYPTSIDTFVDPTDVDTMIAIDHASEHTNANDAISAIENFLGTSGSPNFAKNASPTLTGTPHAPTNATATDSSTQIATDAFVQAAIAAAGGGGGGGGAPLVSPAFTGTPTAPTQSPLTNNTDLATTQYTDLAVGVETTARTAADALHALIASPTFTGTPHAPTNGTATDATTQIATDAFVQAAIAAAGAGTGMSSLTGDVTGSGSGAVATTLVATTNSKKVIYGLLPQFYAGNPLYATAGSIGTGSATNDTTAMTNCAAAMIAAGGGIMLWPAGTFKINTWPTFPSNSTYLPYAINGVGKKLTIFQNYATSLATSLTITAPGAFVTSGPAWRGWTIDGTNATSTAVGIHWCDVSDILWEDVEISNHTLTDNWYWHNVLGWCEDMIFVGVTSSNAKNIMHFAVGSAGYSSFDYWVMAEFYTNLNANQSFITEEASLNTGGTNPLQTLHEGCHIRAVINAQTGGTNTGVLLNFKGWSAWTNTHFDIHAEVDGSGVCHQSLNFANNNATFQGSGVFTLLGSFTSPTFSGGVYQAEMSGRLLIPGLFGFAGGAITVSGSAGGSATVVSNQPTPPTLVSGTPWTNNTGCDVTLYVPYTLTATSATLKLAQQSYTISAAGATVVTSPVASMAGVLTLRVNSNERIRIDVSTGTIGTVQAFWG